MKLIYWALIIVSIAIPNASACSYAFETQEAEEEFSRRQNAMVEYPSSREAIEVLRQTNHSITAKKFRRLRQTADYLVLWEQNLPFYMLDVAKRISSSNNIKLKLAMMDYYDYAEEFIMMLTSCDSSAEHFSTLFYRQKPHTYSYWEYPKGWIDFHAFEEEFFPKTAVCDASIPYYRFDEAQDREDEGYSYYRFFDKDLVSERVTFLKLAPEYKENTYATWMIIHYAEMMGVVSIEYDSVEDVEKYTRYIGGCALFIGNGSSISYKEYTDTISHFNLRAQHKRELIFINSNSEEIKRKYGAEENTLILFTNQGEYTFVFDRVPSSGDYKRFINENFFMPNRLRRQKPAFILLFKDNSEASKVAEQTLRTAAVELRNEALFIIRNVDESSDPKLLNEACIRRQTSLPTIRFMQDQGKRFFAFPLEGKLTQENIQSGLKLYKEGRVERLKKSQDILDPPYKEGFRLVVKDTWNDIVLDKTKNRLVLAYCYKLWISYTLSELYKKYGNRSDMVFAAVDVCQNDIELLPMLETARLYLKGSKDKFEYECDLFNTWDYESQYSRLLDKIYRPDTIEL